MLAADAVIAEVAGRDELWQEHIREDEPVADDMDLKDTQPWEDDGGILDWGMMDQSLEGIKSGIFDGALV